MTTETPEPTPETPRPTGTGRKETRRSRTIGISTRKLAIAGGSLAIFAAGTLLGIGVTHHASGISSASAATRSANEPPAADILKPADSRAAEWNPFQELRNMQLNMDRMFDRMTTRLGPPHRQSVAAKTPGYSLSLRLKDVDDHYEVRARLPDIKASDVQVSLLDRQTLKVAVSDRHNEGANATRSNVGSDVTEWDRYDEILELPGPVKSEHVKVDQANHQLLVTLPKA